MTEELKKDLKEALDTRLHDILFEEFDKAKRVTEEIVNSVLQKHNVLNAVVAVSQSKRGDISTLITFDGGTYECKITAKSASFDEIQADEVE